MKSPATRPSPLLPLLIIAMAFAVYILGPAVCGERQKFPGHFPEFAKAMLGGRVSIPAEGNPRELIYSPRGDRFYLAYPPLPSILLMPFVAFFGGGITSQIATRIVSVLNVAIFDACLVRVNRLLGRPPLQTAPRLAIDALFAFGTVTWHNALFGGDWHLAHAVVLCAMLLALFEYAGKRRPLVIGLCMAAVIMTRPTAVLAGLFFALPWIRGKRFRELLLASVFPIIAVAVLAYYNWERFGNPLDFGYSQMYLRNTGKDLMQTHGQFHPRFIPINAFWFFLAPPHVTTNAPFVAFDPHGMSMFLATPALLYAFVAIARHLREKPVQDAVFAIAACLIPLLAYFNTGFWQFGHRFSMDYLAILMFLVIWGMKQPPSRLAWAAIIASIAIQCWGNLYQPVALLPASITPAP